MITIDQLKDACKRNIEKGLTESGKEQAAFFLHIIEENKTFEKEIAALKQENENLLDHNRQFNEKLEQANIMLEESAKRINNLIEANANLQCCGNCENNYHLFTNGKLKEIPCKNKNRVSRGHCPSWKSDNLTQKERAI